MMADRAKGTRSPRDRLLGIGAVFTLVAGLAFTGTAVISPAAAGPIAFQEKPVLDLTPAFDHGSVLDLDYVDDGTGGLIEVGKFRNSRKFRSHRFRNFRGHGFSKFRGKRFSRFYGPRFGKFRGRGFGRDHGFYGRGFYGHGFGRF